MDAIPPRSFLFLRHGETDWNREGRFQGATDVPLNAVGLAQAEAAAERVAGRSVSAIVASPLVRARKTASHLGPFEALCQDLCGSRFEGRHATPYLFRPGGDGWQVDEITDARPDIDAEHPASPPHPN